MTELTIKGKSLLKSHKIFDSLEIKEQKLLYVLDMGEKYPNKDYYGESIKKMRKDGYII
jgi:hypothetical protein